MIGIYGILNSKNNKIYIGKSKNIELRLNGHSKALKNGTHHNKYLQYSWNKYGEDNFNFIIIEECNENELNKKEKYWISNYNSNNSSHGYNLTIGGDGGNTLINKTPEQIKKIKQLQAFNKTIKKYNNLFDDECQLKIINLYNQNYSIPYISKNISNELNKKISSKIIWNFLKYKGIKIKNPKLKAELNEYQKSEVKRLFLNGKSLSQINKLLNITNGRAVPRYLEDEGLYIKKARNVPIVLSAEEQKIVIKLFNEGNSALKIKNITGLSYVAVKRFINENE